MSDQHHVAMLPRARCQNRGGLRGAAARHGERFPALFIADFPEKPRQKHPAEERQCERISEIERKSGLAENRICVNRLRRGEPPRRFDRPPEIAAQYHRGGLGGLHDIRRGRGIGQNPGGVIAFRKRLNLRA